MADKTEFLQAIDDAILDADSLERFINGSDSETVLTRLSKQYPTLQNAIKQMFESGGLPATPFKTKASMQSSSLDNGSYAVVTEDTNNNNGVYIKDDGLWVKSKYGLSTLDSFEINSIIYNLPRSTAFSADSVKGAYNSWDYALNPSIAWSVNNGALSIGKISKSQPSGYMWTQGQKRNNSTNIDIRFQATAKEDVDRASAVGVTISEEQNEPWVVYWFSNGTLAISNRQGGGAKLSTGVKPAISYAMGQLIDLSVSIKENNTGVITANNITSGGVFSVEFDLDALGITMQGTVYLVNLATVSMDYSYYNVSYPEVDYSVFASSSDLGVLSKRVSTIESLQLSSGDAEPKTLIPPPNGFLFKDYGFNIYRGLQTHKVFTDFDIKSKKINALKSIYVDNQLGADTNSGSEESPVKSVSKALELANTSLTKCNIFISSGHYNYLDVGVLPKLEFDTNIICEDADPAVLSLTSTEVGWIKDSVHTNLYKKTISGPAPIWAFDDGNLDEYGEGRGLKSKTTLALANADTGSIFIDGQTVYVRLLDDRQPDKKLHIIRDMAGLNSGATSIYIENVHILGGNKDTFYIGSPSTDKPCYAYNCRFSYGNNQCFRPLRSKGYVYAVNCIASWSKIGDGFSYATPGPVTANIVEINCKGHHNGLHSGSSTSNGSTMHEGGKIIRITGDYSYNNNKNIADTGEGTQSWCIKCIASSAQDPGGADRNLDYIFSGGGNDAWLDDCLTWGSKASFEVGAGSVLHIRNMPFDTLTVKKGVGDVVAY